jgi:dUTP pyrophosphatase
MVSVLIKRLDHAKDLGLPYYATEQSSGMDLVAANIEPITIEPFKRVLIETGICIALPEGFEGQIRSRSGLSLKNGVIVLNTPGTIDADYRGEIKLILANLSEIPFVVERGMRLAQLVIAPVSKADLKEVDVLPDTYRAAGGFGSTGV